MAECQGLNLNAGSSQNILATKNLGDASRVPRFRFLLRLLSVSSFSLSSWLPLTYSPFPFFMDVQRTAVATV